MKRLVANILVVMLLFSITINLMGCSLKASYYTEEEHIQRITERIDKKRDRWNRMYLEGETYSDFKVYPLYNENDEFRYCLVEFEPYGFVFISIVDEPPTWASFWLENRGMYVISGLHGKENPWTPYIRDKNNNNKEPILDKNDELIIYDKSPYFVANSLSERKYLLKTNNSSEFICAIEKNGKFLNLISGLEFEPAERYYYEEHATFVPSGWVPKPYFYL